MYRTSVLLAALLTGCGTLPTAMSYVAAHDTKVTLIPADIDAFRIKGLDVYESPNHPQHVWLQPHGRQVSMAVNSEDTRWVAMLDRIEPVYRKAAANALAITHPGCELASESLPYPDYFAMEFAYSCKSG